MGMSTNSGTGGQPQGPQQGFGMPAGGYGQNPMDTYNQYSNTMFGGQPQGSQQGFGQEPNMSIPQADQQPQGPQIGFGMPPGGYGGGMGGKSSSNPQDVYNQYTNAVFGTPTASYTPNFGGGQQQSPVQGNVAGNVLNGAMGQPQDVYNQYTNAVFGTPTASYTPNFGGGQQQSPAPVNSAAQMQSVNARPGTQMSANSVQRQQNNVFGNNRGQTAYASPVQQAQFGGAGQMGSARDNLLSGRAPLSNAVAARQPVRPAPMPRGRRR